MSLCRAMCSSNSFLQSNVSHMWYMYIPELLYYVLYNAFCILIHFCIPYHTLGSSILSENWCACYYGYSAGIETGNQIHKGCTYSMVIYDKVHVYPGPLLRRTPCHRFFFYTKNTMSAHPTHGYLTPFVIQIFVCKIHTAYMCVQHLN